MFSRGKSWQQLLFYGEIVGFVLAWAVGVFALAQSEPGEPKLANVERYVSVSDLRGTTTHRAVELK